MNRSYFAVCFVTLFAAFFQAAPFFGVPDAVVLLLYSLAPFLVIYMCYMVLRFGTPSEHNFDNRFYEDWDYVRNGKEELEPVE